MPKYEDIFTIQKFAGINQACDGDNINPAYAVLGANFDTAHGGLKAYNCLIPLPGGPDAPDPPTDPTDPDEFIDKHIPLYNMEPHLATLMFLHKRWQLNAGVIGKSDSLSNTYMIMVVDGKIYWRRMMYGDYIWQEWHELLNPSTSESFAFTKNRFDWISYEMNYLPPETLTAAMVSAIYAGTASYVIFDKDNGFNYYKVESSDGVFANAYYKDNTGTSHLISSVDSTYRYVRKESPDAPIDCLLLTNDKEGMYCIYAPLEDDDTLKIVPVHVGPADQNNILCGCLSRHYDRIWVAGISTDPDKCMYSVVRDAFNWEQDNADPANGAGDIQQPTWDGDEIKAIKEFGNNLLVIKQYSIWRILGATPDEFQYRKQYGEGTIAEDTFAVNGAYAYMLTDDDVKVYDGNSTHHFKYGAIKDLLLNGENHIGAWEEAELNEGRMLGDKYILYFPGYIYYGEDINAMAIYDTVEGTVNLYEAPQLMAFEVDKNVIYGVYSREDPDDTSVPDPLAPGSYITNFVQVAELMPAKLPLQYREYFDYHTKAVTWESSWLDLGAKNAVKSGFNIYLLFKPLDDLTDEEMAEARVTCTVSVRSEKRMKSKTVTLPFNKMKRVRVNLNSRAFRIKLDIAANKYRWRIGTGVNVYLEYDAD